MLSFIPCLKIYYISNLLYSSSNEWEEVYKTIYSNETYSKNQTYIGYEGDFYVCNVYFSKLGKEGVIILESWDGRSLISTCTFENSLRINESGGSISNRAGKISIRKVCSYGSKAKYSGNFCDSIVIYNSVNTNEMLDSSIIYSSPGFGLGYSTISLWQGNNSFLQNNVTRNSGDQGSAFDIGTGHIKISIKYSIINENNGGYRICYTRDNPIIYDSIIFVNNTISHHYFHGMFYCWGGDVTLENCFIANNKQNNHYLFYIEISGSFAISNSYIDTKELLYESGQKVTIRPFKEVSVELRLLSTGLCPGSDYSIYMLKEKQITDPIHFKALIKRRR